MDNSVIAEFAAKQTVQQDGVTMGDMRSVMALLAPLAGARGGVVEALKRQCFLRTVNPLVDGYCYLSWFADVHWSDAAQALEAYPSVARVLAWAEAFEVETAEELYVARVGDALHVVDSSHIGAVSYRQQAFEVKAKMQAMLVGGSGSDKNIKEVLVTVDVPDIKNFLLVHQAIADNPEAHVNVVLHPRPVDLRSLPPDVTVADVAKGFPFHDPCEVEAALLTGDVMKHGWLFDYLDDDVVDQYSQFRSFSENEIVDDSVQYMTLSAARLRRFLMCTGVWGDHVDICVDYGAMSAHVPAIISHAMHKEDYFFGYDSVDVYLQQKEQLLSSSSTRSSKAWSLRLLRLDHMERYLFQMRDSNAVALTDYSKVLDGLYGRKVSRAYIGGPFTQLAAALQQSAITLGKVFVVAGLLRGQSEFFIEPLILALDYSAAEYVLLRVGQGEGTMQLMTTEFTEKGLFQACTSEIDAKVEEESELMDSWLGSFVGEFDSDWALVLAKAHSLPTRVKSVKWRDQLGLFSIDYH